MVPLSCIIELSCLYLYSMLIVLFSKFSARVIFDDLWSKYENEPALFNNFFGHEKTSYFNSSVYYVKIGHTL